MAAYALTANPQDSFSRSSIQAIIDAITRKNPTEKMHRLANSDGPATAAAVRSHHLRSAISHFGQAAQFCSRHSTDLGEPLLELSWA
jgi:hypothetical protein